jgi:pimeloyl-ACP methyl ester carboxylesterase
MQSVDLARVTKRSDAGEQLLEKIDNPDLAPFFLQSLDIRDKRWLLNLDTLAREMSEILGFPEITGVYEGKVMFLAGAESDYVRPEYRNRIKALFPRAQFAKIPGAGHWLHAEKPRDFEAAVRHWLER